LKTQKINYKRTKKDEERQIQLKEIKNVQNVSKKSQKVNLKTTQSLRGLQPKHIQKIFFNPKKTTYTLKVGK